MTPLDETSALYSIGAVASLTGLPTSTLRSWERRYGAVTPRRTPNGGRRYSEEDVERIQLLHAITRAGVSIGLVASLPTHILRARMDELQVAAEPVIKPSRVAFVHRTLANVVSAQEIGWLDIVETVDDVTALHGAPMDNPIDVVFVEFALLGTDPAESLQEVYERTSARLAVVEYAFGRGAQLALLAEAGARVMRGPLRVSDVVRIVAATRPNVHDFSAPSVPADAPEPRFTAQRLAQLREIESNNACECPSHVATLVTSLAAFEQYSRRCMVESPTDREFHAGLALGTGRARAVMEELLMRLCEHDGIDV